MAFHSRNSIVTDGLVFSVDAYNTKSYIGSGTSSNDLTINSNNGTLVNGVVFDNNAFTFDGVNDYIDFDNILSDVMTGSNPVFSVDCWYKSSTTSKVILGKFNLTPTAFDFLLWQRLTTSTIRVSTNGGTALATTPDGSVIADEWINVTAVIDNSGGTSDVSIYLNGLLSVNTTGLASNINNNNYPLVFGKTSGGVGSLNRSISNVKIYNKVLTPTEVLQNYEAIKWRFQ